MVADEPTTALDVSVQAQILDLIDQLRRDLQLGVLLVTHNIVEAERVLDRVVLLDEGHVVATGPPGEVMVRPRNPRNSTL